jgi:hypothetical protein
VNDPLLPPDAAARDAARRQALGELDDALHGDDIRFATRRVSDDERAASRGRAPSGCPRASLSC